MNAENKKIGENIGALSEEAIVLLKQLVKMLSPITATSTTPFNEIKLEAASDGGFGFSTIAGTIPTITSVNQLGGCGIVANQSSILFINNIPINGGRNYTIGDIITLSGGTNGSVIVTGLYDKNISAIDITPISGGTGYVGGEIITITNDNGNGRNGQVMAFSVDNNGSVVEVLLVNPGYDYYVGNGNQVYSTGSGSGLIVNITSTIENIGSISSVALYTPGSGYTVGTNFQDGNITRLGDTIMDVYNDQQLTGMTSQLVWTIPSSNGTGLIVEILAVDTGYGNTNYLQSDIGRWLYSDMIRNNLN
jgi:hypothetical protein